MDFLDRFRLTFRPLDPFLWHSSLLWVMFLTLFLFFRMKFWLVVFLALLSGDLFEKMKEEEPLIELTLLAATLLVFVSVWQVRETPSFLELMKELIIEDCIFRCSSFSFEPVDTFFAWLMYLW